jgi:hypothetical protein
MTQKQNDQSNQKPDSKSHQEKTQEGKKITETYPNNLKANQNNEKGSQQKNEQQIGPSAKQNSSTPNKTENQNNKKGSI